MEKLTRLSLPCGSFGLAAAGGPSAALYRQCGGPTVETCWNQD
jgi:hypothetical protein